MSMPCPPVGPSRQARGVAGLVGVLEALHLHLGGLREGERDGEEGVGGRGKKRGLNMGLRKRGGERRNEEKGRSEEEEEEEREGWRGRQPKERLMGAMWSSPPSILPGKQ